MSDSSDIQFVPSPCVSVCALDEDDVCVGCYRTGMEISQWGRMSVDKQRLVVVRSHQRMRGELGLCVVGESSSSKA
jgi:uncharacterized protein